jgi:hypothetical protein
MAHHPKPLLLHLGYYLSSQEQDLRNLFETSCSRNIDYCPTWFGQTGVSSQIKMGGLLQEITAVTKRPIEIVAY